MERTEVRYPPHEWTAVDIAMSPSEVKQILEVPRGQIGVLSSEDSGQGKRATRSDSTVHDSWDTWD